MPMLAAAWPQILEAPPVSSLGRPTLQHVQPLCSQLVAQLQHSPALQTDSTHTLVSLPEYSNIIVPHSCEPSDQVSMTL